MTKLPFPFDPKTGQVVGEPQDGSSCDEIHAASLAEGKCSHCGAKFLKGADRALTSTEADADLWCDDGRVKRPPKQMHFLLCFSCFEDEFYDPEDPKPGLWQWGRC